MTVSWTTPWTINVSGVLGYRGPHWDVPGLYSTTSTATFIVEQIAAHSQADIIMVMMCRSFRWLLSGCTIEKYLCILMYISVWKDVIKQKPFIQPFSAHSSSPNTHLFSIRVVMENGTTKRPTSRSVIAKFSRNRLVRVRIPLWRMMTNSTIMLPTTVQKAEIDMTQARTTENPKLHFWLKGSSTSVLLSGKEALGRELLL